MNILKQEARSLLKLEFLSLGLLMLTFSIPCPCVMKVLNLHLENRLSLSKVGILFRVLLINLSY